MALHRDLEGARAVPARFVDATGERRLARTSWQLASGTLACPACDAPVLPAPHGMSPSDAITCGYCRHGGAVRDFLSLAEPTRPARVVVRVRGVRV